MHLNYIKGRFGYASSSDIKALLGLKPGQQYPVEGMPERLVQGVRVYVAPLAPTAEGRRLHKHRVIAICGYCSAHVSVGRLHQHQCPTLTEPERLIRALESLPIYGNHHHDSPAFEQAHVILMGDAPMEFKIRALRRIDEMTGCNEFPPDEAAVEAYIKECREGEGPVLDAGQLRERIAQDTAAMLTMLMTDDPQSITLYDILNDIKSDVSAILAEADRKADPNSY